MPSFQLLAQLRSSMTDRDVMLVFDTKGDFHKEFYRPGDTVISNEREGDRPGRSGLLEYISGRLAPANRWRPTSSKLPRPCSTSGTEKNESAVFPQCRQGSVWRHSHTLCPCPRRGDNGDNARLRSFLDQSDGRRVTIPASIACRHEGHGELHCG